MAAVTVLAAHMKATYAFHFFLKLNKPFFFSISVSPFSFLSFRPRVSLLLFALETVRSDIRFVMALPNELAVSKELRCVC